MHRTILIFALMGWLFGPGSSHACAQSQMPSASSRPPAGGSPQTVDGVAARIEDDIITDSEVHELAAFQQLVDGHPKPRIEIIRELADQWLLRGEAETAKFPQPSEVEVDHAYAEFLLQFPSPEDFRTRLAAADLTEAGVRRMLAQQLYLSHFIDYRFRPAAQVDDDQIETYYNQEFAPKLKALGQPVPALDDVTDTIREVLIQRAINDRATKWLDETRDRLKIDILMQGDAS